MASRSGLPRALHVVAASQVLRSTSTIFFAMAVTFSGVQSSDLSGLGLTLAAQGLPTLVLALLGGVAADRWNKVRLVQTTGVVITAATAAVGVLLWGGGLGWPVQILALVCGTATALGAPSLYTLVAHLVPEQDNLRANAEVRSCRNAAGVVGPPVAAALAGYMGNGALALVSAGCMLASVALMGLVRIDARAQSRSSLLADLTGLRGVLTRNRAILGFTVLWALFLAVEAGASSVLQPAVVLAVHDPSAWSMMASAGAVGYVVGSLISLRLRTGLLISLSFLAAGAAGARLVAVAVSDSLVCWYAMAFLAGIALEISGVLWGSALQTRVDTKELGRVSSVDYALSFGLRPVGLAVVGLVASAPHVRQMLGAAGAGLTVLALLAAAGAVAADLRARPATADLPLSEESA